MTDFKDFIKSRNNRPDITGAAYVKPTKDDITHVAMFSDFFNSLPDNFFCSNNMYSDFRDSLVAAIDIYRPAEKLVVDIFESEESNEDKRDFALIGFRKYIGACYRKLHRQVTAQILSVSLFALIGILLIFLVYAVEPELPEWILKCLDIMGNVLVWQFVGYWAFEFAGQFRELKRLKQVAGLTFVFHAWE